MRVACVCQCHIQHDDLSYKYGVDVRDPVACILACNDCRRHHAAVLDDPPSRPLPEGDTSTAWLDKGEGAE